MSRIGPSRRDDGRVLPNAVSALRRTFASGDGAVANAAPVKPRAASATVLAPPAGGGSGAVEQLSYEQDVAYADLNGDLDAFTPVYGNPIGTPSVSYDTSSGEFTFNVTGVYAVNLSAAAYMHDDTAAAVIIVYTRHSGPAINNLQVNLRGGDGLTSRAVVAQSSQTQVWQAGDVVLISSLAADVDPAIVTGIAVFLTITRVL